MRDNFDLDIFGPQIDDLHTPYVVGAKFNVQVSTNDANDTTGWTIDSSDPSVLTITAIAGTVQKPSYFDASAHAVAVGHTTLTVRDKGGHQVDTHDVAVGAPDRAVLYAHGLLLAGESDDKARVDQVRVLAGGQGTFLVRYFQGSSELSGSGALQPTANGPTQTTTAQSTFATARDWLQVSGTGAGAGQIRLAVGGVPVSSVPFTIVDPTTIASVALAKESDSDKRDGHTLYVFARALDAQGNDVYGGSFQWQLDGNTRAATGWPGAPADTVSYEYKASSRDSVTATFGTLSTSVGVHANVNTVALGSTKTVNCSVGAAPGGNARTATAFVLALIAACAMVRTPWHNRAKRPRAKPSRR